MNAWIDFRSVRQLQKLLTNDLRLERNRMHVELLVLIYHKVSIHDTHTCRCMPFALLDLTFVSIQYVPRVSKDVAHYRCIPP